MASLQLRGNTWHLLWRWRGRPKSRSTKVTHDGKSRHGKPIPPPAAKRELRKLENDLDQGRSFETKTLSQLLDLVEKDYEVSGYRSVKSLKSRLEHIKDWFGNLRADRITENDFLEYGDFRRKQEAANQTINLELEVVMKALRMGKINPLPTLKKLKRPAPRQGFFDDAKITAVCKRLPEYLRAPTMFGYYTGWRREEVFGLEWRQVDFDAGEVRLWDSKNELQRVFPLDVVPGLRELLSELAASARGKAIAPIPAPMGTVEPKTVATLTLGVFVRKLKSGQVRLRMMDFRKAFATACTKAGHPGMLFHDLRRSAARNLELAGWPRSMVMEWMGHETESMFHRYRIVSAADREVVSKRLANGQSGNVKEATGAG